MTSLRCCFTLMLIGTSVVVEANIDLKQHLNGRCPNNGTLQFQCDSGECVPFAKYRDGRQDCADGSDEECLLNQTRCDGDKCVTNPKDCKDYTWNSCDKDGYVRCPFTTVCFEGVAADLETHCGGNANITLNATEIKRIDESFTGFQRAHGKSYSAQEVSQKRATYRNNYVKAEQHNSLFKEKKVSFEVSLDANADRTLPELVMLRNGAKNPLSKLKATVPQSSDSTVRGSLGMSLRPATLPTLPIAPQQVPFAWDWRTFNRNRTIDSKTVITAPVTSVKDQGQCGSCWAFSAVDALAGAQFACDGSIHDYSPQSLIDCSGSYGTDGCYGGWPALALSFVKDTHMVSEEHQYPYKNANNSHYYYCALNPKNATAVKIGVVQLPNGDEKSVQAALVKYGPLSVAIYASVWEFMYYKSGVFTTSQCKNQSSNHAVVLVGYGTDPIGGDYWIVKNSWGKSWGENGYVRMARNRDNMCNVASDATYADMSYNPQCNWAHSPF